MRKLVVVAFLLVAVTLMATAFPSNSDAFFGKRGGGGCGCYSGYSYPAYGWGSYYWPASYGWYSGYGYGGYGYGRGYGRGMRGGVGFGMGY